MEDKPIALRRLLAHTRSERALVAMFLALLELVACKPYCCARTAPSAKSSSRSTPASTP